MSNNSNFKSDNFKIRDGFWGIYEELENTPEERWDPFRTTLNASKTLIGHRTFISKIRDDRPHEYQVQWNDCKQSQLKEGQDSFCRLVAGKLPSIVLSKDQKLNKTPFSSDIAFEDLRDTKVFSSINLFPPMARVISLKESCALNEKIIAKGIPIVHILTKHYTSIEEIPEKELIDYFNNIILTLKACAKILLVDINDNVNVFHFYNIGARAGASIPHLHSQTLLQTNKKGYGWKNYSFIRTYEEHKRIMNNKAYCLACEYTKNITSDPILGQNLHLKDRLILENKHWMLFSAYAPERDGQLRLIPKRHVSAFWDLNENEINSLANTLIMANMLLSAFVQKYGKKLFIYQDRNILFRQKHFGSVSDIHMLIDIVPFQRTGGAEILDNYRLSHVFPEEIAKVMKNLRRSD